MFDAQKYEIDKNRFKLQGATYQVFSLIPRSSNKPDLFPKGVQVLVPSPAPISIFKHSIVF